MSKKGPTSTTTAQTSIPAWENTKWQDLVGNTQKDANMARGWGQGYLNTLQGQFARASNDMANQHVNAPALANDLRSSSQGVVDSLRNNNPFTHPQQQWNTQAAQQYMNPYTQSVLSAQHALDNQSLGQELAGVDENAAAAGALGGDRNAVTRANVINVHNAQRQAMDAQALQNAYTTGLGAFDSAQARDLQNRAGNAQVQQAAAQGNLGFLQNAIQDQLAGSNSNVYADYAQGQNNMNLIGSTQNMLLGPDQAQAGILRSLPDQSTHAMNGYTTKPWWQTAGQVAGLAMGAIGGMGGLGGIFGGGGGGGGIFDSSGGYLGE